MKVDLGLAKRWLSVLEDALQQIPAIFQWIFRCTRLDRCSVLEQPSDIFVRPLLDDGFELSAGDRSEDLRIVLFAVHLNIAQAGSEAIKPPVKEFFLRDADLLKLLGLRDLRQIADRFWVLLLDRAHFSQRGISGKLALRGLATRKCERHARHERAHCSCDRTRENARLALKRLC